MSEYKPYIDDYILAYTYVSNTQTRIKELKK